MFHFECLKDATRNVCKISAYIEENICFLYSLKTRRCSYRKKLAHDYYICNCPTRYELFERYGI